jgi:hypothetical protein
MQCGVCWELTTLVLITNASEFGYLPTPLAQDYGGSTSAGYGKKLSEVARMIPTPVRGDASKHTPTTVYKGGNPTLTAYVSMFPTPTVNGNYNRKGLSQKSGDGLATYVQKFPTPTVNVAKNAGSKSQRDRNSPPLDAVVGGKLNPPWVEWLMGIPEGWTSLKPLAMPKYRKWQQQFMKFFTTSKPQHNHANKL